MAWTIQRTHAQPWPSRKRPPALTSEGTIVVEWTGDPAEVWTTTHDVAAEYAPVLGADVAHWGGLPIPDDVKPGDEQAKALVELVERRAKAGDAVAIAAREALASETPKKEIKR